MQVGDIIDLPAHHNWFVRLRAFLLLRRLPRMRQHRIVAVYESLAELEEMN